MTGTINKGTGAVIEAVLEALDVRYPATLGDEPTWLRCFTDHVMYAVITLRMLRERPDDTEWLLARLTGRLADHPPTYRTRPTPGPAIGENR